MSRDGSVRVESQRRSFRRTPRGPAPRRARRRARRLATIRFSFTRRRTARVYERAAHRRDGRRDSVERQRRDHRGDAGERRRGARGRRTWSRRRSRAVCLPARCAAHAARRGDVRERVVTASRRCEPRAASGSSTRCTAGAKRVLGGYRPRRNVPRVASRAAGVAVALLAVRRARNSRRRGRARSAGRGEGRARRGAHDRAADDRRPDSLLRGAGAAVQGEPRAASCCAKTFVGTSASSASASIAPATCSAIAPAPRRIRIS